MPDIDPRRLNPSPSRRSRLATIFALALLVVCALGTGVARAESASIEGVWSFNGGEVAITGNPDGTFTGTVVKETKFAICYHPVGQQIWTSMKAQPDGSYYGYHQWYISGVPGAECALNPDLGQTTWRVLSGGGTSSFLRVCFSNPATDAQPQIAADGTASDDDAGCSDSSLVSTLPKVDEATAPTYIQLPSTPNVCLRSTLRVVVKDPKGAPIQKASAYVLSGGVRRAAKIQRKKNRVIATFDLGGLPSTQIKVTVAARTVLGQKIKRSRSYSTLCGSKPKPKHHRRHRHHS